MKFVDCIHTALKGENQAEICPKGPLRAATVKFLCREFLRRERSGSPATRQPVAGTRREPCYSSIWYGEEGGRNPAAREDGIADRADRVRSGRARRKRHRSPSAGNRANHRFIAREFVRERAVSEFPSPRPLFLDRTVGNTISCIGGRRIPQDTLPTIIEDIRKRSDRWI